MTLCLNMPSSIVSRRLIIREIFDKDAKVFSEFMMRDDHDVSTKFWSLKPCVYNEKSARDRILEFRQGSIKDYYIFRIGAPHVIVGAITLNSDRLRSPRLSYFISKDYRRKNFAGEAYDAVVQQLLKRNKVGRIFAEIDWDNVASRRFLLSRQFELLGQRKSANFNLDEPSIIFQRKTVRSQSCKIQ